MLSPSIFSFENSDMSGFEINVDSDQSASQIEKPADQDPLFSTL